MNYTNREVVHKLKQYDMFLNSLSLTNDPIQRERICDQLDKIEKQILLETNSEYEENYMLLLSKNTKFLEEEKSRLRALINLINDRHDYLEQRKINHKKVTGSLVELTTFLGEDKLTVFKNRLKIIEKYEENKVKQDKLIKEIKELDIKISEASRSVKSDTRLNESLENKMTNFVNNALEKFKLYDLINDKDDILNKYNSLEYAYGLAKDNLKSAKELCSSDAILECDSMLADITSEYQDCYEKVNILRLIDIYDRPVSGYDDLLSKREKINTIMKNISNSSLYKEIGNELEKQFNTIKLEKQDISNYDLLKNQREVKNKILYEIEEENNSREFKLVLDELIKNENRYRENQIKVARQKENMERQKKLMEEQKLEASRIRRQKLIEEARLKEQLANVEKMKKQQENTIINVNRDKPKPSVVPPKVEKKIETPIVKQEAERVAAFDTDELFENSRLVPNKVDNNIETKKEEKIDTSNRLNTINTYSSVGIVNNKNTSSSAISIPKEKTVDDTPVWNSIVEDKSDNKTLDLFKEEEKKVDATIPLEKKEVKEKKAASIYDMLENNDNIMWKSTETKDVSSNKIPVIGNNNLRPEKLENESADMAFPELGSKDGDILWKETL